MKTDEKKPAFSIIIFVKGEERMKRICSYEKEAVRKPLFHLCLFQYFRFF
ncbi:hypothetical protein B4110_1984 [Parageobacillus toebii]|uniref:Uncharacterized protein n=1 Tax=Parageobacillus toebii TaxID=153151 RepID=A0A150N4I0_9BACL|nr:hypothetical protein B4110_1984 [Parageobacillus toebii]